MADRSGMPVRILVINPNTSKTMTESLIPILQSLGLNSLQIRLWTCPEPGIPSINSPEDATESAGLCLPHLLPLLNAHDAFLVACYSQHPLVPLLQAEIDRLVTVSTKYVTGIFEASVLASLSLLREGEWWGIISTGKVWELALTKAVAEFLSMDGGDGAKYGPIASARFLGVGTTGLHANELHEMGPDLVKRRMRDETKLLVEHAEKANVLFRNERNGEPWGRGIGAICLGCAGMAGLEEAVRQGCVDVLGGDRGRKVRIVDGVKAGVVQLFGMVKAGF